MLALALLLTLAADELTPAKAAKVQKDRDQAMADIAKKYGNKKSSELTPDERRAMIQDQSAAETSVLEKNDVDAKDLARYEARMSKDDRAATKTERERLDKKEADDKKAAEAKAQAGTQEVQVQKGFSDSNPVMLEETNSGNGAPVVEKGLPQDAQDDQAQASGSGTPSGDLTPTKKSGKTKK